MGVISGIVDLIVVLFSAVMALSVPLIDAQACLPESLYPGPLVALKRWYADEYGDYLLMEPPHFFSGLVWVEIVFLWPLAVATLYGVLVRRSWSATTSLMLGVSTATSMAAIMPELLGSGRASEKLIQMYAPFAFFALIAIVKGLFFHPRHARTTTSHGPSPRKKRV